MFNHDLVISYCLIDTIFMSLYVDFRGFVLFRSRVAAVMITYMYINQE